MIRRRYIAVECVHKISPTNLDRKAPNSFYLQSYVIEKSGTCQIHFDSYIQGILREYGLLYTVIHTQSCLNMDLET